jgi:enamine deaminase RidA (YjgF/YER057c/UK114 family)
MSLYPGTPYNYSATAQGLVFTAGACPLDERGTIAAPGDFEAQALRAVENLLAALSTHDIGPESLLKTTVFVVARDRSDLVRVWDVVSSRLGRVPSTLLLGVTSTYLQGIDTTEIIDTVRARRPPMIPASAGLRL